MICDVDDWASTLLVSLDVVTVAVVIYLDIDVECLCKCSNLNVVPVGTTVRHAFEISLPLIVDLLLGWRSVLKRS